MGTKKIELTTKSLQIRSLMGSMDDLISLVDDNDIHFEIGKTEEDGTTKRVYGSKSITRTMNEYAANGYTEEDGYRIDIWEGEEPAADICVSVTKPRLVFEINHRVAVGTSGNMEAPEVGYEYETVFRDESLMACVDEYRRKGYTKHKTVIDVRESKDGAERYHVGDIDIDSTALGYRSEEKHGKDWLVALIRHYTRGDKGKMIGASSQLAERILEAYSQKK